MMALVAGFALVLFFCLFSFVSTARSSKQSHSSSLLNGPSFSSMERVSSNPILHCNSTDSPFPGESLVFCDDFDYLDLSIWEHSITMGGGGNWEFEYYINNRSNSFVRDSKLFLKPTLTADTIGEENVRGNNYVMDLWGSNPANLCTGNAFYGCSRTAGAGGNIINPIQSASIRSARAFNFKYGRVEIKAKLPVGDWIWPAIWMLPRYNSYGEWPASGEIDIMESRGNPPSYPGGGCDSFGSTLHWGPSWTEDPYPKTHATYKLSSGTLADDYHIFGLKWTDKEIFTYIDNEKNRVLSVNTSDASFWTKGSFPSSYENPWVGRPLNAPFDQEYFLIMNVAVGGTASYFPDGVGGKPWTNSDSHAVNSFYNAMGAWYPTWKSEVNANAMQIDWVKIYQ